MVGYCVLLAVFMWVFLMLMRVHYIIDLITGVMIGHWCAMQADWLCYFADVKLFGLPHKKRQSYVTVPCKKCGWNNQKPSLYIDEKERTFLRQTYRMRVSQKAADNKDTLDD